MVIRNEISYRELEHVTSEDAGKIALVCDGKTLVVENSVGECITKWNDLSGENLKESDIFEDDDHFATTADLMAYKIIE